MFNSCMLPRVNGALSTIPHCLRTAYSLTHFSGAVSSSLLNQRLLICRDAATKDSPDCVYFATLIQKSMPSSHSVAGGGRVRHDPR